MFNLLLLIALLIGLAVVAAGVTMLAEPHRGEPLAVVVGWTALYGFILSPAAAIVLISLEALARRFGAEAARITLFVVASAAVLPWWSKASYESSWGEFGFLLTFIVATVAYAFAIRLPQRSRASRHVDHGE